MKMQGFTAWLESREKVHDSLSAVEIRDMVGLADHKHKRYAAAAGDDEKLLQMKYKEAEADGLLKDVLKNGVLDPLRVEVDSKGRKTLTHGHHRLAIALRHFPGRKLRVKYEKS